MESDARSPVDNTDHLGLTEEGWERAMEIKDEIAEQLYESADLDQYADCLWWAERIKAALRAAAEHTLRIDPFDALPEDDIQDAVRAGVVALRGKEMDDG